MAFGQYDATTIFFCNNLSWSQSLNRKVKQTTPLIHKTGVTYGKHLSVKLVYNRSWFNSRDWRTSLSLRCICTIQCIKTRRSESFQSCAFTQINFSPSCLNLEKISWYQMFQILSIPRVRHSHMVFYLSIFALRFGVQCRNKPKPYSQSSLNPLSVLIESLWAGSNKRSSIGSDKALSPLKSFHTSSSSTRSCSWCSNNSLQKSTLHMHSLKKTHQTNAHRHTHACIFCGQYYS